MAEKYALLFHYYKSAPIRVIRFLFLFFVIFIIIANIQAGTFPNYSLFFLIWITIIEIFFHFKIARIAPDKAVSLTKKEDMMQAFTFPLLEKYVSTHTTEELIKTLCNQTYIKLLLEKAMIQESELTDFLISKDEIGTYALELVTNMKGKYITTSDFITAYLLLSEKKTHLLFSKQIKPEELLHLLFWIRHMSKEELYPKKLQVHVSGSGIGEALTTGWTPETEKYTDNYTYRSLSQSPVSTGREDVTTTMLDSLTKPTNNNILLIGDAGSGKENLVQLFAKKSFQGEFGGTLDNKEVYELMIGPLIAGTSDRGLLEERLQAIIAEVAHSGNVLLYIPEMQNILGASTYNIDLSGAMLPYLKEGYLPIIATMTPGNYKAYVERNALKEVFTTIKLDEPDMNTAMHMVLDKTEAIEKTYSVIIPYQVVKQSIAYSKRYIQDDVLPGSAITLLTDVSNTVSLSKRESFARTGRKMIAMDDVISHIENKTHIAVSEPTGKEKELLLHFEEHLHKQVIGQIHAINVIAEAMRRLRSGLSASNKPISFLFLGPTGVGKTETARALAKLYFGGEDHIIRLDMSEYSDDAGVKRLLGALPGEGNERGELTDKVHDHPSSLILLDEFEKANPKIRDLFLQVFEDGRLTDNKGKTVSFINTIIIATSNAGAEFIRETLKENKIIDKNFQQSLLNHVQQKGIFRPELLNRFDDVVTFFPLTLDEIKQVTLLLLQELKKKLNDEDITVTFDDSLVTKIANDGYDHEFGARPIRRYLQDTVEDLLAKRKLEGSIKRGSTVTLSVAPSGEITSTVI